MILLVFSSNIGLLTMYEINVVFLDQCKNKIPYKLRTVVFEVSSFADNPKSTYQHKCRNLKQKIRFSQTGFCTQVHMVPCRQDNFKYEVHEKTMARHAVTMQQLAEEYWRYNKLVSYQVLKSI